MLAKIVKYLSSVSSVALLLGRLPRFRLINFSRVNCVVSTMIERGLYNVVSEEGYGFLGLFEQQRNLSDGYMTVRVELFANGNHGGALHGKVPIESCSLGTNQAAKNRSGGLPLARH